MSRARVGGLSSSKGTDPAEALKNWASLCHLSSAVPRKGPRPFHSLKPEPALAFTLFSHREPCGFEQTTCPPPSGE